jgi:hypothetical protein
MKTHHLYHSKYYKNTFILLFLFGIISCVTDQIEKENKPLPVRETLDVYIIDDIIRHANSIAPDDPLQAINKYNTAITLARKELSTKKNAPNKKEMKLAICRARLHTAICYIMKGEATDSASKRKSYIDLTENILQKIKNNHLNLYKSTFKRFKNLKDKHEELSRKHEQQKNQEQISQPPIVSSQDSIAETKKGLTLTRTMPSAKVEDNAPQTKKIQDDKDESLNKENINIQSSMHTQNKQKQNKKINKIKNTNILTTKKKPSVNKNQDKVIRDKKQSKMQKKVAKSHENKKKNAQEIKKNEKKIEETEKENTKKQQKLNPLIPNKKPIIKEQQKNDKVNITLYPGSGIQKKGKLAIGDSVSYTILTKGDTRLSLGDLEILIPVGYRLQGGHFKLTGTKTFRDTGKKIFLRYIKLKVKPGTSNKVKIKRGKTGDENYLIPIYLYPR